MTIDDFTALITRIQQHLPDAVATNLENAFALGEMWSRFNPWLMAKSEFSIDVSGITCVEQFVLRSHLLPAFAVLCYERLHKGVAATTSFFVSLEFSIVCSSTMLPFPFCNHPKQ